VNVELDAVGAKLDGAGERREGILGTLAGRSAVGDDLGREQKRDGYEIGDARLRDGDA
jgi:hypothetical protein